MTSIDLLADRDHAPAPPPRCPHCPPGDGAFCAGVTGESGRRLAAILGHVPLDPGVTIFREGDPALHLYAVGAGAVKLYKLLPDGRRQVTAFLFRGDFFGLPLDGGYAYTAETLGPVLLCRFTRRRLDGLFDEIPDLQKRLLTAVSHELAAAHDQMLLLGRKTAREKVASFLMMLWRRLVAAGEVPGLIALPMSRADIADFLGLTIETVSRVLTILRGEGLIAVPDAGHVSVIHVERLSRIGDGA